MNFYRRTRAWLSGLAEGYRTGRDFSSGITWTDGPWLNAGCNESYDAGVNCGQALRTLRAFGHTVHQTGAK